MTGSAGVGHFFHRLVNKTSAMIQVDQLFNGVGKRPLKKQGKLVRWTSIASWHCRRPLVSVRATSVSDAAVAGKRDEGLALRKNITLSS